jgi:Mg-chelatase subunit ChlI
MRCLPSPSAATLQNALTGRIVEARTRLKTVAIPYDFRVKISAICSELNVDGIRGDIVTNRAAKALASFEGRDEVAVEDIYRCVMLCYVMICHVLLLWQVRHSVCQQGSKGTGQL